MKLFQFTIFPEVFLCPDGPELFTIYNMIRNYFHNIFFKCFYAQMDLN